MTPEEIEEDIERFELEGATKLGPSEFARFMSMKPQLVHYYIRTKVLTTEMCACGRRVIDVEEGSQALASRKKDRRPAFPEASS